MAARAGPSKSRSTALFRAASPEPRIATSVSQLAAFFQAQKRRFELKELDAAKIAGPGEGEASERAAWTHPGPRAP